MIIQTDYYTPQPIEQPRFGLKARLMLCSAEGGLTAGQIGGAAGDIFSGVGQLVAAGGYSQAAGYARENAALTARMTAIEVQQADRMAFKVLGGQQADVAAAGFSLSGSAIDLMTDSARAASLDKRG